MDYNVQFVIETISISWIDEIQQEKYSIRCELSAGA